MLYEFLINKHNKVSHFQPSPCTWGKKEVPPWFTVVTLDTSSPRYVQERCIYDTNAQAFVYIDYPTEHFSESDVLPKLLALDRDASKDVELAEDVKGETVKDIDEACKVIGEPYGTIIFVRNYWHDKFLPYRALTGIEKVRYAALKGHFSDFAQALNEMPQQTQSTVWPVIDITAEDKLWLKNILKVESPWLL